LNLIDVDTIRASVYHILPEDVWILVHFSCQSGQLAKLPMIPVSCIISQYFPRATFFVIFMNFLHNYPDLTPIYGNPCDFTAGH